MNTLSLTDKELINYTIKFSNDPDKVRLATVMERMTVAIIDDLVDAGMDDTWCTFRSDFGGEYHPGRYITHLENEIQIAHDEMHDLRKELEELKARTVLDLLVELKQEIKTAEFLAEQARQGQYRAEQERNDAKSKLKMWTVLSAEAKDLR